ncbi:MAG: nucleotidyltransferase domain-containing protein [Clostridia bacterium]|nr:nucleotidyltransferase domain-containing protein [Clostridia bacterium]
MNESIRRMTQEIDDALDHGLHSLWLYGSVAQDDFRPGWSDIDFIAFSKQPVSEEQAVRLLPLRQDLSGRCPENPYYRCFEGIIVSLEEYLAGQYTRLVYWGTSGQRITDRFRPDPFSRWELVNCGRLIHGEPADGLFTEPTRAELIEAVRRHCEGIRRCAVRTDEQLYSCGWLLDMARCMYTLRCGGVIAKTRAGEWALNEHLFPEEAALQKTLLIRQNPPAYKDRPEIRSWLRSLGPTVQRYADVLEQEIKKYIE